MPSPALVSHESMSAHGDGVHDERRGSNSSGATLPIATGSKSTTATMDKQSLDYVWRTGVAGGVAGCVVRFARSKPSKEKTEEWQTGQRVGNKKKESMRHDISLT